MGRGAPFSVALLLILYSLGIGSASDGHGSGSLDLRALERQSKDFLKSIELEHVGKKRRKGKSGTDDVEGWSHISLDYLISQHNNSGHRRVV